MLVTKRKLIPAVCLIITLLVHATYYRPFDPYYSQVGQDKYVIENIFHFKKNGVFVDIGAHDGISYSNTYYMEKYLGWTGICVEPQEDKFQSLQQNRTCICVQGCIFNQTGEKDFVFVDGPSDMLSGLLDTYDPRHMERAHQELEHLGGTKKIIKVKTYNLNEICAAHNITHIDFLSIDTEGSEEQIIKSINFDTLDISVITVENNYNSNAIFSYLTAHGYKLLCNIRGDEIYMKNEDKQALKHYYCTPSDARHFPLLKNLIGSIHHVDFQNLGEIAVFDLGLTDAQRSELSRMEKVSLHSVEMTHPHLLTYFTTAPNGRQVRGFFAWKPVIMKQALDLFSYCLYVDAGTTVLKPLNDIFSYICEHGYFLMSCEQTPNCNIINRVTKKVLDTMIHTLDEPLQNYILDENTIELDAGLQGISRKIYDTYIHPLYECSKDLTLFEDDGSAKFGYGEGRHDQILFSIYAHALHMTTFNDGWINLPLQTGNKLVHIHWHPNQINHNSVLYRSRWDINFDGGKTQYIKYKNS